MFKLSKAGRYLFVGSFIAQALSPGFAQERIYRNYATPQVIKTTIKEYPEYQENLNAVNQNVPPLVSKGGDEKVYQLPVIFHLVSSDSKTLPDQSQVQDKLDVLNKAFGSYDPNKITYKDESFERFAPLSVNPQIQFYIPETFEGAKGINAVKREQHVFRISDEIQNTKSAGLTAINSKKQSLCAFVI